MSTPLPPGVEYASLNAAKPYMLYNGRRRVEPAEQRMLRYEYERRLRNPPHIRQGLSVDYWEAPSDFPLLIPRTMDFRTWADYIHASRDVAMEIHRNQMRAYEKRKQDHPKISHFLDSFFKERLFEKSMEMLATLASGVGRPDIGIALGMGAKLG